MGCICVHKQDVSQVQRIFTLRGPTSKQRDGLKITEGLEGERMIEEEKFKNRKKVF